jgi:hypothetical protein
MTMLLYMLCLQDHKLMMPMSAVKVLTAIEMADKSLAADWLDSSAFVPVLQQRPCIQGGVVHHSTSYSAKIPAACLRSERRSKGEAGSWADFRHMGKAGSLLAAACYSNPRLTALASLWKCHAMPAVLQY